MNAECPAHELNIKLHKVFFTVIHSGVILSPFTNSAFYLM